MGLDPATAHNIREFIRRLKGEKTIILCIHYMDEADLYAIGWLYLIKAKL